MPRHGRKRLLHKTIPPKHAEAPLSTHGVVVNQIVSGIEARFAQTVSPNALGWIVVEKALAAKGSPVSLTHNDRGCPDALDT